jgi:hypothetical protein
LLADSTERGSFDRILVDVRVGDVKRMAFVSFGLIYLIGLTASVRAGQASGGRALRTPVR